jgi:hypothetical protein
MTCPPEVADILLAMLQTGLLRIRAVGISNDSRRCAIEADHLHNLPALLSGYSADLLQYYWDFERTAYIGQSQQGDVSIVEDHWIAWNQLLPANGLQAWLHEGARSP